MGVVLITGTAVHTVINRVFNMVINNDIKWKGGIFR